MTGPAHLNLIGGLPSAEAERHRQRFVAGTATSCFDMSLTRSMAAFTADIRDHRRLDQLDWSSIRHHGGVALETLQTLRHVVAPPSRFHPFTTRAASLALARRNVKICSMSVGCQAVLEDRGAVGGAVKHGNERGRVMTGAKRIVNQPSVNPIALATLGREFAVL
jgi:hypothetical protein